jgi:hypothetical protein
MGEFGSTGRWGACEGDVGPDTELCDGAGLDEDCDGSADEEGCLCPEGVSRPCGTSDVGECRLGAETCVRGAFAECEGAVEPIDELCNGLDDDCDGSIDEGVSRECATACGRGVESCEGAAFTGICTAPAPGPETCNGLDDDCDGSVDESLSRACSSVCGGGTETCVGGAFTGCTAPSPTTEVCNGRDDDCDGRVDESDPSLGTACGGGGVSCSTGTLVCSGGALVCSPGTPAGDRDRDGIADGADPDDDNDGIPDTLDEFPLDVVVSDVRIGFDSPAIGAGAAIANQWASAHGVRFAGGFTATQLSTSSPCANAPPLSAQHVCTPLMADAGRCSGPAFGTALVATFDPGTSYDYVSMNNRTSVHCRSGCSNCLVDGDPISIIAHSATGSTTGSAVAHNGSVATNDAVATAQVRRDSMTRIEVQMGDSDGIDDLRLVDLRPPCP